MTARATYVGEPVDCPDCGERIEPGEDVALVGDAMDRHWACDSCAEVHDDEEPDV